MAFLKNIGSFVKQAATSSRPSLYQALRCMSSSKVFVGGISYATDEQSLRETFGNYGEVVEARIIYDRESGRSRGFGFVTYTSSEEASAAMSAMDGKDFQGRVIRVNFAHDRAAGPRGGYGGGGYGGGGYGGGGYGGGGYGQGGGYGGGGYGGGGGGGDYGAGGYGGGAGGDYGSAGGYGGGGGGYNTGGGGFDNSNTGGGYGGNVAGGYGGDANDVTEGNYSGTGFGGGSSSGFDAPGGGNNFSYGGASGGGIYGGAGSDTGNNPGGYDGATGYGASGDGNVKEGTLDDFQDAPMDGNDNSPEEPDAYADRKG